MAENTLRQLAEHGQSVWYDNLTRDLLRDGGLAKLISLGIVGVTANPTIFEKAVSGSDAYDSEIAQLARSGLGDEEIYDRLIVEDVRSACDLLAPAYAASGQRDGYVSLEVAPKLARETAATVAAAQRYRALVDRPNLMIKIPGTEEGVPAVEEAIALGLNINVTLIFAVGRYHQVMEAYCRGLERRLDGGLDISSSRSVASFFVSRVDTEVDRRLDELTAGADGERAARLAAAHGTAAITNAALAYRAFEEVMQGPRFARLAAAGAAVQRPLWASTSTKNPAYRDVLYCEELIAPHTVNTMPPVSVDAFLEHGRVRDSLAEHLAEAPTQWERLANLGIDLADVTRVLEEQGVASFSGSMDKLLAEVAAKRERLGAGGVVASPRTRFIATATSARAELGPVAEAVAEAGRRLTEEQAVARLAARRVDLWPGDSSQKQEMAQRMGWLDEPSRQQQALDRLKAHRRWVRDQGFRHALLVGMGGSSLCPEVLRATFGTTPGFPELLVLDSTDPDQVAAVDAAIDPARTLLLVASKSGGTTETMCHLAYFHDRLRSALGERAGEHCVAITDPGTSLEARARELDFHQVFSANPEIGGRYSALSDFGLVPAATIGVDLDQLVAGAIAMAGACAEPAGASGPNPGAQLAAVLAGSALQGRNKVTIVADPRLAALPIWIEQLLAESTGKQGRGLVPVVDESLVPAGPYGDDRLFVHLHLEGATGAEALAAELQRLAAEGHPVVSIPTAHLLDLGAEFYRWEVATALAGSLMAIDPFDQPNVQESKDNTAALLRAYDDGQGLPEPAFDLEVGSLQLTGCPGSGDLDAALRHWLSGVGEGWYLALMAYLPMRSGHPEDASEIAGLRRALTLATGCATTFGFGPRFLHSTGQLHKGGPEKAAFLQITGAHRSDLAIPGRPYTFGVLQAAQALGDYQALAGRGRKVLRVHLRDVGAGLAELGEALERLLAPVGGSA
ncbi:MAG: bifunctional transaldolase/phosoglucose isomerase [Candidatus Dormiibacterota bacterium]